MSRQPLLEITNPAQLLKLCTGGVYGVERRISDAEIIHLFEVAGALWRHENIDCTDEELRDMSGLAPHAGLSKGGCSNAFLNTLDAISYSQLAMLLAREHAARLREVYTGPIDWVIGSDHAAAMYSGFMAYCLGARHDYPVKVPKTKDEAEKQVWNRFIIGTDEVVLRCEELSTTGATPDRVTEGVESYHGRPIRWAPVNAFAVNRTEGDLYRGNPIIALLNLDFPTWASPNECPMCAAGSKRIEKPKLHWYELTNKT